MHPFLDPFAGGFLIFFLGSYLKVQGPGSLCMVTLWSWACWRVWVVKPWFRVWFCPAHQARVSGTDELLPCCCMLVKDGSPFLLPLMELMFFKAGGCCLPLRWPLMFQPCKLRRWCYFSLRQFSFADQFEDPFSSKPWISIVFCQICKKKYRRCLWNKNVIGTKEKAKMFWKVLLLFCLANKRLSLLKPWFVLGCYLPILLLPLFPIQKDFVHFSSWRACHPWVLYVCSQRNATHRYSRF